MSSSSPTEKEYSHLESLPEEMKHEVLSYVNPRGLLNVSQVSRRWKSRSQEDEIWKKNFIKEFPETQKVEPFLSWYENYKLEYSSRKRLWDYITTLLSQYEKNVPHRLSGFLRVSLIYSPIDYQDSLNNPRSYLQRQFPSSHSIDTSLTPEEFKVLINSEPKFKIWDNLSWTENLNNVTKYHLIKAPYVTNSERFYYILVPRFINHELIEEKNMFLLQSRPYEILPNLVDVPLYNFDDNRRIHYALIETTTERISSDIFLTQEDLCSYILNKYQVNSCYGFMYNGKRYEITDFDVYYESYNEYIIKLLFSSIEKWIIEYRRKKFFKI